MRRRSSIAALLSVGAGDPATGPAVDVVAEQGRREELPRRHRTAGVEVVDEALPVETEGDRLAPIVIDDQVAAVPPANRKATRDLPAHLVLRSVFKPKLDGPHAQRDDALHPGKVGKDRIENVE